MMCKKAPAYATDGRPLGTDSDFRPPGVHIGRRLLKDPPFGPFTFCFFLSSRLRPFNSLQFSYN